MAVVPPPTAAAPRAAAPRAPTPARRRHAGRAAAGRRASQGGAGAAKHVVVVGGGVVGTSCAYFLAKRGCDVTLLEREARIAPAASGKAGGFLAADWGDGVTTELHVKGFDLHAQLADELNLESYRTIPTLSVRAGKRNDARLGPDAPKWLDGGVASASIMDDPARTAQVTPLELTTKLADGAVAHGATIRTGVQVVGMDIDENDRVVGVRTLPEGEDEESLVPCTDVLVAMGVWSTTAAEWFGLARDAWPITGIKSTHCVWDKRERVRDEPRALFCGEDARFGTHLEVYPRSDGSLYICGIGGSDYVEGDRLRDGGDCARASLVEANPDRVAAGSAALASLTSEAAGEPDSVGACMRPCPPDARPIIGPVLDNAYVCAGTNCWGISWGPLCGLAMSELLLDGTSSVSLAAFSPFRFLPSASRRGGRGRKQGTTSVGEQW